jgi:hypothetical protein
LAVRETRALLPAGIATVTTTVAVSATSAAATTITAIAVAARGLGLRLVHTHRTPVEGLAVERVNSRLCLFAIRHLHEAESL